MCRLTVLLFAGVALGSASAHAQTLAEAAAVAQAAHATGMGWPASKNGVPTTQAAAATLQAAPLPSVADLPPVPAKANANTKQPEAYWRARWAPLTAQLTTDRLALDPLALRYLELQARFNSMRTVFQQQLVAPEMFRIQTELRKAQALVDQDLRAIADLEEDGRRAGALPGWFRN